MNSNTVNASVQTDIPHNHGKYDMSMQIEVTVSVFVGILLQITLCK